MKAFLYTSTANIVIDKPHHSHINFNIKYYISGLEIKMTLFLTQQQSDIYTLKAGYFH